MLRAIHKPICGRPPCALLPAPPPITPLLPLTAHAAPVCATHTQGALVGGGGHTGGGEQERSTLKQVLSVGRPAHPEACCGLETAPSYCWPLWVPRFPRGARCRFACMSPRRTEWWCGVGGWRGAIVVMLPRVSDEHWAGGRAGRAGLSEPHRHRVASYSLSSSCLLQYLATTPSWRRPRPDRQTGLLGLGPSRPGTACTRTGGSQPGRRSGSSAAAACVMGNHRPPGSQPASQPPRRHTANQRAVRAAPVHYLPSVCLDVDCRR